MGFKANALDLSRHHLLIIIIIDSSSSSSSSIGLTMSLLGPLPLEIVQHIISYLTHDSQHSPDINNDYRLPDLSKKRERSQSVARYAAVNSIWQDAIERETFADLTLNLNRFAEFQSIIARIPRRETYIRVIRLDVLLPPRGPIKPGMSSQIYSDQAGDVLQETFVAFIRAFNSRNASWRGPPITLHVAAWQLPLENCFDEHPPYALPSLELQDPELIWRLGTVDFITAVKTETALAPCGRRLSGSVLCTLLAALPAAREVFFKEWDSRHRMIERSRK